MGEVYLAEHTDIEKPVAIKVLGPDLAMRRELVERFIREAKASSKIRHPHVVDITDFGYTDDGVPYFVMEYLEGEGLAQLLRRERPLTWERARDFSLQICKALQAAHEQGIYHRDVKPDNCFVVQRGERRDFIKVLDFGIAKVVDHDDASSPLTQTGVLMGTAAYMSPEQAQSFPVDARADVYSVGVMLYEMLTGRVPFEAPSYFGVLTKHVTALPPAFAEIDPKLDLPNGVETLVGRALAKKPDERFASASALADALTSVGHPQRRGSRRTEPPPSDYVPPKPPAAPTHRKRLFGLGAGVAIATALVGGFLATSLAGNAVDPAAADPAAALGVHEPVASEPDFAAAAGSDQAQRSPSIAAELPSETSSNPDPATADAPPRTNIHGDAASGHDGPEGSVDDNNHANEAGADVRPPSDAPSEPEPASRPTRPSTTKATPKAKPTPTARTRTDLARALTKLDVSHCTAAGGMPGMKVKANVTFGADGSVTKVAVLKPFAGSKLGQCVAEAATTAKTKSADGDETTTFSFKL